MKRIITKILAVILIITSVSYITSCEREEKKIEVHHKKNTTKKVIQDNDDNIELKGIPVELVNLYNKNPEAQEFVLSFYTENYSHNIDLHQYDYCSSIPHFIQWDCRWGYESYNGNYLALTGCGPTCLSMVAVYLTGDSTYSPLWMANFLDEHGYAIENVGTAWSIFDDGVQCIDLYGYNIGTQKDTIISYLMSGYPVICSMGPGDFTDDGHFVVITGYNDGCVSILDPNSNIRSKDWRLEDINDQMVSCWAMYVGNQITDSPDYCEESVSESVV